MCSSSALQVAGTMCNARKNFFQCCCMSKNTLTYASCLPFNPSCMTDLTALFSCIGSLLFYHCVQKLVSFNLGGGGGGVPEPLKPSPGYAADSALLFNVGDLPRVVQYTHTVMLCETELQDKLHEMLPTVTLPIVA